MRTLVPVELEPAERVEDLLHVLGRGALAVGVLDAQDEGAARASGRQPVVQCGARPADVKHPRGGRREPDPHLAFRSDVSMLIGAHVSTAGGLVAAHTRGRRARLRGDPGLQPVAAHVAPHELEGRRHRRVPRADGVGPDRVGGDPRRLPHQLRRARTARSAASRSPRWCTPCGWATRSGPTAWCSIRALRSRAPRTRRSRARARPWARRSPRRMAACCFWRTPPAPERRSVAASSELAELLERAGGNGRLGVCLDSCHLLASGFDVADGRRPRRGLGRAARRPSARSALRCLHVNDSKTKLGSNSDRHAPLGTGELGARGLRGVPLGAALRGPADAVRGPRLRGKGAREGGHPADQRAAPQRPAGAKAP